MLCSACRTLSSLAWLYPTATIRRGPPPLVAAALSNAPPSWRVCYRGYDALSPVQAVLVCIEDAIVVCVVCGASCEGNMNPTPFTTGRSRLRRKSPAAPLQERHKRCAYMLLALKHTHNRQRGGGRCDAALARSMSFRCGSLAESNSTRAERDHHIRSGGEREEDGSCERLPRRSVPFGAVVCSMGSSTATMHSNHACTDSLEWRAGTPLMMSSSKNLSSHPPT